MKKCPKCNQWKEKNEFYKSDKRSNGFSSYCKICMKYYNIERRDNKK